MNEIVGTTIAVAQGKWNNGYYDFIELTQNEEDMKYKFIENWTSKLQNVFDTAPTQLEREQSQEILS